MSRSFRRSRPEGLLLLATLVWPAAREMGEGIPLPIARFRSAPGGFTAYSGIDDSLRVVVEDAARWETYWRLLHAHVMPAPPVPSVDFGREMVILAALGTRGSGGFTIRIDSAYDVGTYIDIVVRRTAPGTGCLITAAFTQPVDIVRIPARRVPVRFRERALVEPCN